MAGFFFFSFLASRCRCRCRCRCLCHCRDRPRRSTTITTTTTTMTTRNEKRGAGTGLSTQSRGRPPANRAIVRLTMMRTTRKILTRGQGVGYTENENHYPIGLTLGCDGVPSSPEVLSRGCPAYHRIPPELGCPSSWSSAPCIALRAVHFAVSSWELAMTHRRCPNSTEGSVCMPSR